MEHNDGQDVTHQPQGGDHRDGHPLHSKLLVRQAVLLILPLCVVLAVQQLHRIVLSPVNGGELFSMQYFVKQEVVDLGYFCKLD